MIRLVLGALGGYLIWSALWLAGNFGVLGPLFPDQAAAFARGESLRHAPYLLLALVLSLACSLLAGLTAAAIARPRARAAVLLLGALLLVTGIAVQAGAWSRMPLWYHLAFLALIVPTCVLGGRLRRRSE